MKIRNTFFLLFALGAFIAMQQSALAQGAPAKSGTPATLKTSGYAPVNGLKMYYEVHGEGEPVVLIHGSYMTIDMNFGELIPILSKTHKVIALEMQGHGRTADINRDISYAALAGDVAALMNYLKLDSANVLGYSLGATVALQLAINHPKLVKKIIFISSAYKHTGWTQAVRDVLKTMSPDFLTNTPLKTEYDRVAPDPAHWNAFLAKYIKFDNLPFDLGIDNVKKVKVPFLIINGDNDGVEYAHIAELYKAVGGGVFADMTGLPTSRLAIVPGSTHVTLMMQTAQLAAYIEPFLANRPAFSFPQH